MSKFFHYGFQIMVEDDLNHFYLIYLLIIFFISLKIKC
ncbi:hypothetical protein BGAFAR04_K0010 (plasmid) [Borreliella garinii Far04]|nr:hypothetical protein BGAFAR04_K0010 [Borreliella garinii Far04]